MVDKVIRVCDVAHDDDVELLADQRRTFALDGVLYEVDFCEEDNAAFDAVWAPWLAHARRVGRGQVVRSPRRTSAQDEQRDLKAVRAWALSEGLDVSSRGRVAQEIIDKYDAAHGWMKIA